MCQKFVKVYFGVQVYSGLEGTVWQARYSVSKVWLHKRAAAADRMELNPSSRHAHSALQSPLYTLHTTVHYSIYLKCKLNSI